ncbi:response regulator [Anabaena cylindrica FACHB-243]|uniref:Response regulator receiver protein n=1 Tax=Anabaena cylindrica (strain ATCC 27899 / PCC 7122) TaxID=272123 RepID=K9ZFM5_ANACC|nr:MULTISPECIES: response regulator [Anabaena]AFZ57382.1 response regulator receiver protein [Anabaena cylindrica PCC 7122]MBD2421064.1 response regulator [Anabaena cylindrica FACHB-243]MBY5284962.1 response regulator [Anabaena sp. CCAP 1446/1C]MBY5306366.1 response regulator [Anabaena sp. CCAP 1446/1C]MCM2405817.1 response regulator [Anabaena sp. CCAP 1446/1C]
MKTLPISRYRFFQKLQPLSLLKKITSKSVTGCLQVFSTSGAWSIYVQEGKLIYACYSEQMFEPLYRNLQRLSQNNSTLPREINEQLQTIFEKGVENQTIPNPDYLAICWLVNEKYLSPLQAAMLIEQLSLEFLDSFLKIEEGSYEFIPESFLDDLPKFCHLNLRLLVEKCEAGVKVSPEQFWQYNQPKTSSTIEVQLPPIGNRLVTADRHKPSYARPTGKKNYTIFCVDDNPVVLNTIRGFLDEQIFSVMGVTDSLKALVEIFRVKPDMILLDASMPNLDGYEICGLLRKQASFRNTPVIMVTEKPSLVDRAKAKLVRASGCMTKPVNQGDLLRIIFQHMV